MIPLISLFSLPSTIDDAIVWAGVWFGFLYLGAAVYTYWDAP